MSTDTTQMHSASVNSASAPVTAAGDEMAPAAQPMRARRTSRRGALTKALGVAVAASGSALLLDTQPQTAAAADLTLPFSATAYLPDGGPAFYVAASVKPTAKYRRPLPGILQNEPTSPGKPALQVAVSAYADDGVGVLGYSSTASGVYGVSTAADAVLGETTSVSHAGVAGKNYAHGGQGIGVYGSGDLYGGKFDGQGNAGIGVHGSGKLYAGQFEGNVSVSGTLTAGVDIILAGASQDCAEDFDIGTAAEIEPGTVMILDDDGALQPSERAYDRKVAGVISGAGDYRPGLILGREESSQRRLPVALVGKVFCKVDAQFAPITVGDLLTTSPTPGHAMKASDPARSFGAVIGKALRPMQAGQGLVPILIALQ